MHKTLMATAVSAALSLAAGTALAAAPADWSGIQAKEITLFYPGTSAMEWITKGTEHGGARALRKGETCADCHSEEAADVGNLIVSGEKNEPSPIAGKAEIRQSQALHELAHRFGVIAGAPAFETEQLPLGPLWLPDSAPGTTSF